VSVTDRCSARCLYCMPEAGPPHGEALPSDEIVRFVALLQARYGLTHVRLTGGEPLLRPRIEELVATLAAVGVADLALTTNGQRLAAVAGTLRQAGLDRINISLDSLDPERFFAISRGCSLAKTLDGIDAARRAGLDPVKLNTVVLRGENDHEAAALVRFAIEQGCQVRFLELMPIGVAAAGFVERFVPSAEVRERLSRDFTLRPLPVDPHATSRNFVADDGRGGRAIVGFISPSSEPFCAGCRRLRLTAAGLLIGCLARPGGIPIVGLSDEALPTAVEHALGMKRRDATFLQPSAMVGIGG
jgi:cyclic pyranopterin phosphate synthase